MENFFKDIRYGLRNLARARGFTFVAILTLAIGIGATTAMFSLVNSVLLRPLPFPEPNRLVAIGHYDARNEAVGPRIGSMSYPDFVDVRNRTRTFESVAAFGDNEFTATGLGEPLHVVAENVSANLFSLLGVNPAHGRSFAADEDEAGHHVVIISDTFWQRHFNRNETAIGSTLNLSGRVYTIVGVMPPGFQFPIRSEARDMWLTFSRAHEKDTPDDTPVTEQRGAHWLDTLGRLRSGVTVDQARADLKSIANALAQQYPDTNSHTGLHAVPELENLIGDTREPLLVLLGAVGLVLLIACANVANLLLARGSARAQEIAIRSALGASRMRIVRQLVTESVVLSLAGSLVGIGFATWALSAVLKFYPANLPRAQEVAIDGTVLAFTIGLGIFTGILFGLIPALRLSTPNLTASMRDGGRVTTSGLGHNRLRSALVIAETALGVMLLIGAGLLMRSLDRLSRAELGFNPSHLFTADFNLSETRYNADQQNIFINDLMQRLRSIPGVTAAAGSIPLPLSDNNYVITFNMLDHPLPKASQPYANFAVVVPGFFEAMQMPLLRGRTFNDHDERDGNPVMIVNQAFAKKYYPNEDPIGRKVEIGAGEGPARKRFKIREIVGIVGDIRSSNLTKAPQPAYYVPLPQLMFGPPTLVIRTQGDPSSITTEVRKTLTSMDPDVPLYTIRSMEDYLALDLGRARFQTMLLSMFAGTALLLTAVGLYGVMAYAVGQRTHEIGVRMALGASRSDVLQMVLRRGVLITVTGIGIGVVGAIALAKLIESLLYEIPPRDPLTYVSVCIVLGCVALLASYIPALRATRIDPMVALRYE